MIPPIISRLILKLGISNIKNNSSENKISSKVNRNSGTLIQTFNQSSNQPSADGLESVRRYNLLIKIRSAWLMRNDGISSARMAGLEWGKDEKSLLIHILEALEKSEVLNGSKLIH